MRKQRVLVLMHEDLIPPDTLEGVSDQELSRCKSEYDVVTALWNIGHDVRPLGMRDDLGVVPLLHLYSAYNVTDQLSLVLDFEGAAASPGRAIDLAMKARYEIDRNWHVSAGYRTLEGGADNDDVYTFAWLHYALAEIGYRF